jgi:hypothetical protein
MIMPGITLSILEFISLLCVQNSNQLFLKRKITSAEMPSLIRKADEDVSEQVKRQQILVYMIHCANVSLVIVLSIYDILIPFVFQFIFCWALMLKKFILGGAAY